MNDTMKNSSSQWEIKKLDDGAHCEGKFVNGLLNGLGILKLVNGSIYEGQFTSGEFDGYGIFRQEDGTTYCGQFKSGQPEGYGLVTFPDGSHGLQHQEGYFENFVLKKQIKSTDHIQQAQQVAALARQAKTNS